MRIAVRPPASTLSAAITPDGVAAPIHRISIVCSKGGLDMVYPGLTLADAARTSVMKPSPSGYEFGNTEGPCT